MRVSNRWVLPVAAALLGGCYGYYPLMEPRVLDGRAVQLALTDSGALALASRIGPSMASIDGTLMNDSAGMYHVAVRVVRARGGGETTWRGERVAVPHAFVSSIEERRFSRARTVLAALGVGAVLVSMERGFHGGGSNYPGGTSTGLPSGK